MKIFCLPVGEMKANCLILRDEATGYGAVVDPGDEPERILRKCEAEGITVKYILLTHAHFDHMMALEALREATGAPLAMHRLDAQSLCEPSITYMAQFAGITDAPKPAEILLEEGDTIFLGETELAVLHTPGHTVGSMCLACGNDLITGDTLFRGSIGRCDLYGGDEMVMQQTLKRLCGLDADYKLWPGHGSTTTLSREKACNFYLKHLS